MSEETQVMLDPAQVEADMIAEEQRKANDPAEQAAILFNAYTNGFKDSVRTLPKKSLLRVLEAVVMSPLVKTTLINDAEKQAFYYADSMLQAKFVMQLAMYKETFDQLVETGHTELETTYELPEVKDVSNT